jgi:hypothetical protein
VHAWIRPGRLGGGPEDEEEEGELENDAARVLEERAALLDALRAREPMLRDERRRREQRRLRALARIIMAPSRDE